MNDGGIFGVILFAALLIWLVTAGLLIAVSESGLIDMGDAPIQQPTYNERCPAGYVLTYNRIQWYCTPGVTPTAGAAIDSVLGAEGQA